MPSAMLSLSTISELRTELSRLRRRVELLEQLLEEHSQPEKNHDLSSGHGTPSASTPPNGSFAAGVRRALRSIGRVTDSARVGDRMILDGHPTQKGGKPIKNRVAVELFRMAKKGSHGVRKVSRGKYKIVEE